MLSTNTPYRILTLDDHPMVLEGIKHMLSSIPDTEVQGMAESSQLIDHIGAGQRFDLFILDLELPDVDGFEVLKTIRQSCPEAAFLIYTMHEEPWILARLARLDIQGVVSKNRPVSALLEAVKAIREGSTYYNDAFIQQLQLLASDDDKTKSSTAFQLSERELQVLQCISKGMTTPEISDRLFISKNTVGTYRHRLMTKFEAHNVAQLIAKAQRFL